MHALPGGLATLQALDCLHGTAAQARSDQGGLGIHWVLGCCSMRLSATHDPESMFSFSVALNNSFWAGSLMAPAEQ